MVSARPNIIRDEWIDPDTERDARHAEIARQMQIARQTDAHMGYVLTALNEPTETSFDRIALRLTPWFLLAATGAVLWLIWRAVV